MEINVFDKDLNATRVLDVFESMLWTDRYDRAGDFEIITKANKTIINSLQEDYYLKINESEHVMIIESVNLLTDKDEGNKFIIRGRSLESILERRIVWDQTILNGSFQEGIKKLITDNVISPADPDRKMTRVIFSNSTDTAVTLLSVDAQIPAGSNLLEVIEGLCKEKELGFKITINSNNKFAFKLYAGVDRSYEQTAVPAVAFSPDLDNLSNSEYYHSKERFKTITLVGGEGEGSEQITTSVALSGGGGLDLDRREKFTDARDISVMVDGEIIPPEEYYSQLANRGIISLFESLPVSYFDGKADTTVNYVYGTDFFIGDIVHVANEYGISGRSRVTELVFSQDLSGFGVYPTFQMIS